MCWPCMYKGGAKSGSELLHYLARLNISVGATVCLICCLQWLAFACDITFQRGKKSGACCTQVYCRRSESSGVYYGILGRFRELYVDAPCIDDLAVLIKWFAMVLTGSDGSGGVTRALALSQLVEPCFERSGGLFPSTIIKIVAWSLEVARCPSTLACAGRVEKAKSRVFSPRVGVPGLI